MDLTTIISIVVAVIVIGYVITVFNSLVSLRNRHQNAFSQIDVQLKRRYDLIPNLVETAKGYLKHERETLEAVISARNQARAGLDSAMASAQSADSLQQLGMAESGLQAALGRFNLVVEDYPELKADGQMQQLSEELTSTENRVAFARQGFNDAVTDYNEYKQSFPPVIFAGLFGHKADASLLEIADREQIQKAPEVSF
ncbi:LemA family protein [Aliamphritea spongicola]|uniref:LemA family protein n=1 Tax=Aliamphritea spongicola TaxID=707589 RepID=UPI00196A2D7F|nr:LemA family protein [Aliamphritea spongicola]MBN3563753.1 LemA family protein [Aliamphritea spongicola]